MLALSDLREELRLTYFLNGTRGFNSCRIIPTSQHGIVPPAPGPTHLTGAEYCFIAEALLKRNPIQKIGGGLIIAGLGALELLFEPDKEE